MELTTGVVWTLKLALMDAKWDEGLRPHPAAQTVKRQVQTQTLTRKNGLLSPWQVQTSMQEWLNILFSGVNKPL